MRNISFALTTAQFLDGTKTVTRRLGWKHLKYGAHLMAVKKGMGLKPGEKIERLGEIEVVSVKRESLLHIAFYNSKETAREGFPEMSSRQFVEFFCEHMGCAPETEVTRIEFKRITSKAAAPPAEPRCPRSQHP